MQLSKMVEMAESVVSDSLNLIRSSRGDAAENGFSTEAYAQVCNAQIDKNLEHLTMILAGVKEDSIKYEKALKARNMSDDGIDDETGKPVGRYYGLAKE